MLEKRLIAIVALGLCPSIETSATPQGVKVEKTTHRQERDRSCREDLRILQAALRSTARADDVLSNEAPEYPSVLEKAEGGSNRNMPLRENSGFWRLGWQGEPPSRDLVHRWYKAGYKSAECASDLEQGRLLGSLIAGWATPGSVNPRRFGTAPATIRATRPVQDRAGSHALVLYSLAGQLLDARVVLILVRRDGAEWREVGSRILAIS